MIQTWNNHEPNLKQNDTAEPPDAAAAAGKRATGARLRALFHVKQSPVIEAIRLSIMDLDRTNPYDESTKTACRSV
jgi:hypothetical protein